MSKIHHLAAPAILLALAACSPSAKKVDMIVKNALIYTLDSSMTTATTLVVHNGLFVETGDWEDIRKRYTAREIIDAEGLPVFPGFIDAHCHFQGYGMWLQNAALNGCASFDEMLERLKKHDSLYQPEWLCGRGWDQNLWEEKKMPGNELLNRLYPDKAVVLIRIDGHAALVNQKALELSGFDLKKFQSAEVIRENGKLTGLLLEDAADFMKAAIPPASQEQKIRALKDAQHTCYSYGLTTVADAGSGSACIALADSLIESGDLSIGLYMMLNPGEENLKWVSKGYYQNRGLLIRSLKLYADGALGSRGACLLAPYSDAAGHYGIMTASVDYLREQCRLAFEHNLQVCTHAIGDSAVRTVLSVYKELLKPGNDLRWRIEHAQLVNPEDMDDFGKYAVIPSIQTTHATSDMGWAIDRLGPERVKHAYAYRQLMQQNQWLPNGSDFPIEEVNPLLGFYAAVARKKPGSEEVFNPENALSRVEALKAMTIWAAKSVFLENSAGSIEPGKNADFVILDTDIMKCREDEILQSKVISVFRLGKKVL